MMYGSWDMKRDRQNFLSFWTICCPFTSLTTQKIKILKNWKKQQEILSFYTCVPKITITWCMVPEILSTTDISFCHFAIFALLPPPPPTPPPPSNSQKNANFKKMKKAPGDSIILHKCTKNHDHMIYCSLDMAHDRCN